MALRCLGLAVILLQDNYHINQHSLYPLLPGIMNVGPNFVVAISPSLAVLVSERYKDGHFRYAYGQG